MALRSAGGASLVLRCSVVTCKIKTNQTFDILQAGSTATDRCSLSTLPRFASNSAMSLSCCAYNLLRQKSH
jgi:hypothetical protein